MFETAVAARASAVPSTSTAAPSATRMKGPAASVERTAPSDPSTPSRRGYATQPTRSRGRHQGPARGPVPERRRRPRLVGRNCERLRLRTRVRRGSPRRRGMPSPWARRNVVTSGGAVPPPDRGVGSHPPRAVAAARSRTAPPGHGGPSWCVLRVREAPGRIAPASGGTAGPREGRLGCLAPAGTDGGTAAARPVGGGSGVRRQSAGRRMGRGTGSEARRPYRRRPWRRRVFCGHGVGPFQGDGGQFGIVYQTATTAR